MLFKHLLALSQFGIYVAHAKAVFAHFMVSNAYNYTLSDWEREIELAQDAHIDAFALNIAYEPDDTDQVSLAKAFVAAEIKGFQLFLSFDYAGNGPWPSTTVAGYILLYSGSSAYYNYGGGPFVSTFEGPDNADDWKTIKATTGCFFVPDWSSLGAKPALQQADGVADGLFNWAAWPWGPQDMDTYIDASYKEYLNGKPYMMPVSPWFYTNLPGYDKNWLWRGDNLWFDRWNEVLYVQPEWVEIISWNDWGESHYIGPMRDDSAKAVMTTGKAPFDFVEDMPHDGWRKQLSYVVDMYVQNITYFTKESVVFWYRPNPATACGHGDTTANTASQLQLEFPAAGAMQDRVFYNVLLSKDAQVRVSIGGVTQTGTWMQTPDNGIGIYHGSVPFSGHTGSVTIEVVRAGKVLMTSSGRAITADCSKTSSLVNWNAWVGSGESSETIFGLPDLLDFKVCVNGTGAYNFAGLCENSCRLGYCPLGACLCRQMGDQKEWPNATGIQGYPAAGLGASYSGLCSYDCNYGYCPEEACATVSSPLTIPTVSPFLPPACTAGTGSGQWEGLCKYACNFGMCPSQICTCTAQGSLVVPPPIIRDTKGYAEGGVKDWGLCEFACPRGYCPPGACNQKANGGTGDPVYIDPWIWGPEDPDPTPVVGCDPPCLVVLPPYTLPAPTTMTCPPLTTTFTKSWTIGEAGVAAVSTITFSDITTTQVPVSNINITLGDTNSKTFDVTPSVYCTATIVANNDKCPSDASTSCSQTYLISSTPKPSITVPSKSKSRVSFTSTSTATPTCTHAGGCGGKASKGEGGSNGGCLGLACPPGSGPVKGGSDGVGGGGGGGGDGENDDCTSSTTVTDTTVFCTLSASPGSKTMDTTCSTTEYETTTGCSLKPITTTSYTSEGCPTLPPYVPPVTGAGGTVPTPGPDDPRGYVLNTGTYTWGAMGESPTSTQASNTAVPTGSAGKPASHEIQWWRQDYQDDADPPKWAYSIWSYYGYDGNVDNNCNNNPSWNVFYDQALYAGIPDTIERVLVYNEWCKFTKSDMKLHCPSWADAICSDITETVGGTCEISTTLKQYYNGLVRCKWS